jgi:hypothetical protein
MVWWDSPAKVAAGRVNSALAVECEQSVLLCGLWPWKMLRIDATFGRQDLRCIEAYSLPLCRLAPKAQRGATRY